MRLSINGCQVWKRQSYTNLVERATATPGGTEIYYEKGYRDDYRWSSSGKTEHAYTNGRITGWMPFVSDATFRIRNFNMSQEGYVNGCYLIFCDDEGNITTKNVVRTNKAYDAATDTLVWTETNSTAKFFKVSSYKCDERPIITMNEEITAEPETPAYTNQVPISTDADGSIYNSTGYKDNSRLSSSGSVSGTAQAGSVVTGFIPFKNTDVIRMKGAEWLGMTAQHSGHHFYFSLYDSNKTFITYGYANDQAYNSTYSSQLSVVYDDTTGVTTFSIIDPTSNTGNFRQAAKSAAYLRINAYGNGADLIVTVNQEIG
jgi:hypothetical protein